MKKILVTGATGFIGNRLIQTILENRNDIKIIASSRNLETAKELDWFSKVVYIPGDIHEIKDHYSFYDKPDVVIHLSWSGLPDYKGLFHYERNLNSEYLFLKNMIESGVERIVVSGTYAEYGLRSGQYTENMPTEPNTSYAFAKDSLRKMISYLINYTNYNGSFCWLRLFNIYGDRQNPKTFLGQLEHAIVNNDKVFNMSKGEQLRDFITIEDSCNKILRLSLDSTISGIFNICTGKARSLRSIAEEYISKKKSNIKLNLGYYDYSEHEPMACWGSTKKFDKVFPSE